MRMVWEKVVVDKKVLKIFVNPVGFYAYLILI